MDGALLNVEELAGYLGVDRLGTREEGLWTELLRFVGSIAAFAVAALLRPRIVYAPGRALERRSSRRPGRGGEGREASGRPR